MPAGRWWLGHATPSKSLPGHVGYSKRVGLRFWGHASLNPATSSIHISYFTTHHIAMWIALTYLEFYSGIGGWGYALEHACRSIVQGESDDGGGLRLRARLLAAYDHSDFCNAVFHHNHRSSSPPPPPPPPPSSSSSRDNSPKRRRKKAGDGRGGGDNTRPRQTPIERLTLSELESHAADVWCMSPPCQPHTRQHANQHLESEDARSRSFLHLCRLLRDMDDETLPKLILLENVVGFEKQGGRPNSDHIDGGSIDGRVGVDGVVGNDAEDGDDHYGVSSEAEGVGRTGTAGATERDPERQQSTSQKKQRRQHESRNDVTGSFDTWRRALSKRNYLVGHFHLDPTHVGIPNNRPRHYTVAFLGRRSCREVATEEAGGENRSALSCDGLEHEEHRHQDGGGKIPQPLPYFLENDNGEMSCEHLFCRESPPGPPIIHRGKKTPPLSSLSSFLDVDLPPRCNTRDRPPATSTVGVPSSSTEKRAALQIPEKIRTSSSSWCFDIASPCQGRVTSCFTHSYGKFVRGTGSILYTGPNIDNGEGAADTDGEKKHRPGRNGDCPIDRFTLEAPQERTYDGSWSDDLDWDLHMRYFSGTEIARLMGFPTAEPPFVAPPVASACPSVMNSQIDVASSPSSSSSSGGKASIVGVNGQRDDLSCRTFSFPKDCSVKQQWKLLGNSLNVRVAASVAEIGIRSVLNNFYLEAER
jgi:site-specific DNA-cytosine methylase